MPRYACRLLRWIVFLAITVPVFATRVKDGSSSSSGEGTPSTCPDSVATPFFAVLDGTVSPPSTCNPQGEPNDPNVPNPPTPYPNRVVTLSGSGFTVTITPALWEDGNFAGTSKRTLLQVSFSGQSGMTLQSLVLSSQLTGATYLTCGDPQVIPYCVTSPLINVNFSPYAWEPTAISLADGTMTRWDFYQFASGNTPLTLMVGGFPSEFANIDVFPQSNSLSPSSFASSNFLAIVKDSSNNTFTAGGLALPKAPAASNDLFSNATTINSTPFMDFIDTSATEPQEVLSGADAGTETVSQGDPVPTDPATANPGTPCGTSWGTTSNQVFRSVWYKFTATGSGNVSISTDGSRYDTGVYVFTGSTSNPTPVACNDDGVNANFSIQSSDVTFAATSGVTYYIMVSEVPPPVGTDSGGNPIADPLSNDATLKFTFKAGGVVGPPANPVPYIDSVKPVYGPVGSTISQMIVSGAGFVSGAQLNYNGSSLTPATISSGQLTVDGLAMPSSGTTVPLKVINPNSSPDVAASNVVYFSIGSKTNGVTLGRSDSTSGGGFSPIAGDFNGDGKLDMVSVLPGNNMINVLLGKGDGTFQPLKQFNTGPQPIYVVQGDFNGDGILDVATADEGTGNVVSVLLGNGDGTFPAHLEYGAGNLPDAIVTGDFNGDGKLDLAVANFNDSSVSILLGNGDGTFQAHVDYPAGSQAISMVTGDFNGDGKLDLALAGGNVVSVLLGNGDGTFQSVKTYGGSFPVWIAMGDFNADGNLDLVTANASADSVSIYLGNGKGAFTKTSTDYGTGTYAYSVAVSDLNGDGKLDLVAGTISGSVPVFLGNGDGTFNSAAMYPSGVSNGALLIADLNKDGRPDVIPSISSGGISVMLQSPTASLSKTSLAFSTQLVGTTSAAKTITLSNNGSARLLISSIKMSGNFAQTNSCGKILPAGSTCNINVTFTPTSIGSKAGTVTITDNASTGKQTISLTGTGTVVKLSAASLNFGSLKVGTKSTAKTVTLTNTGTTSLSITSISVAGTDPKDFAQTHTCGTSLAAGKNCTISVTFQPTATGTRTASVNISDNGGGSPQKISLSGDGT